MSDHLREKKGVDGEVVLWHDVAYTKVNDRQHNRMEWMTTRK